MALSLISTPNFSDLQNLFDPIRSSFDFVLNNDQMEYNGNDNSMINQSVTNTNCSRNYNYIGNQSQTSYNNDCDQVINFVDSPPNSEESWTDEQNHQPQPQAAKATRSGPTIIDVQTIYGQHQQQHLVSGQRKRRMDWNSLEINQNGNNSANPQPPPAKISNFIAEAVNSNTINSNAGNKEKEKKKTTNGNANNARGSWTDDIDFDLNGDFNSSGYLNNEAFLSFSPTLTVLKQEIHSPQGEQLKDAKSPIKTVAEQQVKSNAGDLNDSASICRSPQQTGNSVTVKQVDKKPTNPCKSPCLPTVDSSKTESGQTDDYKFQYILAAATSIATKNNEETLTYLNQGQSYEIKLKKIGDLSFYRDKILKSVIKICFHERRLQYMEREQMQQWQASRPGERIIEVDVPLSYGLCHVSQPLNSNFLNTVEIFWDPLKEVGVYIKVNCISTEFTPKKHGGEKGVPFRIQIETYIENANNSPIGDSSVNCNNLTTGTSSATDVGGKQAIHAAACQIKVFKLKGADRKHKQDREKIQRRPQSEQEKFQPSYECTIMNDIPLESLTPSNGSYSPEYMKIWPNSPVHMSYANASSAANSSPIAINSVTSTNTSNLKLIDSNMVSPQQVDMDDYQSSNIMTESTAPSQVAQWLTYHRLAVYVPTFAHFSGSDILRMSKDDLIQICGIADGIRMYNILHAKAASPRLTIYVSLDNNSFYAIYLTLNTPKELNQKLFKLPGFYELCGTSSTISAGVDGGAYSGWGLQSKYSGSGSNIFNDASKTPIYIQGPSGVHVTVTDEVLNYEVKDGSLYSLEVQNGKVLMKLINKNDN